MEAQQRINQLKDERAKLKGRIAQIDKELKAISKQYDLIIPVEEVA